MINLIRHYIKLKCPQYELRHIMSRFNGIYKNGQVLDKGNKVEYI